MGPISQSAQIRYFILPTSLLKPTFSKVYISSTNQWAVKVSPFKVPWDWLLVFFCIEGRKSWSSWEWVLSKKKVHSTSIKLVALKIERHNYENMKKTLLLKHILSSYLFFCKYSHAWAEYFWSTTLAHHCFNIFSIFWNKVGWVTTSLSAKALIIILHFLEKTSRNNLQEKKHLSNTCHNITDSVVMLLISKMIST